MGQDISSTGANQGTKDRPHYSMHFSCKGDPLNLKSGKYGGIVIWGMGSLTSQVAKISGGYVYLKTEAHFNANHKSGDEGMCHGTLCREITGY